MYQKVCSSTLGYLMLLVGIALVWLTSTNNISRAADPATTAPSTAKAPASIIRIAAGRETPFKDSQGNIWEADKAFDGGQTIERPELKVTGTSEPGLYCAERYSMDSYTLKVPNGTYTVKLHFSEDYDGHTSPDDRIFTFDVQGQKFKDFSPWKKAGAQMKAYVETVKDVKVTDGKLKITFTPQVENPQINALEIIPDTAAAQTKPTAKPIIRVAAGRNTAFKDAQGNIWDADKGFDGGQTLERAELKVTGTDEPGLYCAEHYGMNSWSGKVPNGTYIVKLHFSEGYEGNTDPDGRIFDFDVQGQKFKDFSPWKKAGAQFKAYVETVKDVKVTDGQIKITFTFKNENPQINALEIIPDDAANAPAASNLTGPDAAVVKGMKYPDLIKLLGEPDHIEGTGVYIFTYKRPGNKELWVGLNGRSPTSEVIYASMHDVP